MNVGIVLPYLKAGGTERQARYIARHLRDAGHRVTIIVVEAKGAFLEEVEGETISLNVPFGKMYAPLLVYRLARTIQGKNLDLLLSRAWNTNMIAATVGLLTGTPYVLFLSGPSSRAGQSRVKLAVEGSLLRRASGIISVSEAARENCIRAYGLPPSMVQVIHNGIQIDEVQALAERNSEDAVRIRSDAFNVVFVGRINHRKGLDILLRALHLLNEGEQTGGEGHESVQAINTWVVGGGDVQRYRRLAEELGVQNRVHFLGEKENPFPEMSQADLFVLPSRSEGFPNVLLEAMALGRAVLAADCETGPDEVIDGENGRLFPVEDHRTLARHIQKLASDEQERQQMGNRARESVREHFQLETQLSKIECILQEAVSGT